MSHSFFLVDVVVVVVCRQVTQGPFTWRNGTFLKTLLEKKKNVFTRSHIRKKIPFTRIRSTENDVVPVPALVGRRKFSVDSV